MNTKATRFSNVKRRISNSLSNFERAIAIICIYIISSSAKPKEHQSSVEKLLRLLITNMENM